MAKTLIQPTAFNPGTRAVTFPFTVDLARVYAILNATRAAIYYSIADPTLIATAAGSVLTLNASVSTVGHLAGDEIAIIYEGDDALTDAQLRATPVPVSGPATDAQLRATPLPVSGPATDAQLRATPLPVSVSGGATSALQTTGNTTLSSILTELNSKLEPADIAGLATETTLAAVLAKIIAAPATEATLAALNGKFGTLTGGAAPVTELPLVLTGAAAQTAIVNNILTVTAGTAPTAVDGFRAGAVQVVSTGTGGSFIFEQSNDNVNFVALPVFNAALTTGVPITAAITPTASAIMYSFPIRANFLRLRIVGTITGGAIQAFTRLSTEPWTPSVFSVAQPTAGSLNATIAAPVLAAGTALAGDVGIQVRANATGAATPFNINSPATPIGQSIKGSAGRLLSLYFRNSNAASRWLKVFNATSVTMGTTAATLDIEIPPTSTGIAYPIPIAGLAFGTGIFLAVTAGKGLTNNAAITLDDVSGSGSFA
jgi:hypothetical protein